MIHEAFHIAVLAFFWSVVGTLVALALAVAFEGLDMLDGRGPRVGSGRG